PECWVALAAGDGRLQREADRVEDVLVQRLGEVLLEDAAGDGGDQARIGGKGSLGGAREFSPDVVRAQGGGPGGGVAALEGQSGRRVDGPHAVALEPPVGLLGVVRLPWRPEFPQKGGQLRLRLAECHILQVTLPAAEGVEDEQRLVRRALVAL